MEGIMKDHLVQQLELKCIINTLQHGFRTGRICLTNLNFEKWTEALDNEHGIYSICLDYRKAFDTVPHRRLISKIKNCGISGKLLHRMKGLLKNRKIRVMLNEVSLN
jgi:Reverse transcriptase (RNA-dependent DNA polymerase)